VTPLLLDISRLVSRAGTGPLSGIDRVERAYIRAVMAQAREVYFLVRLPRAYAVLDRKGGQAILDRIEGRAPWGGRGLYRILSRLPEARQRALADVARLAVSRGSVRQLKAMLRRVGPSGLTYLNVGHSNLRGVVFDAVKQHEASRVVVLVHDVIPITSPDYSRSEVAARFIQDMKRVAARADAVIYNSQATREEAEAVFRGWGRVPECIVAHLGAGPDWADGPVSPVSAAEVPHFITIGTIEPRKNHALLLDIWRDMERTMPEDGIPVLHIVGRRGWNNEDVFRILDDDPMMGCHVFEHGDMSDQACRDLLATSRALLFPSRVEGFGMPLLEAARLGVPILCGENALYREFLGDYPLYLNVDNSYSWKKEILERAVRNRESEAVRQARSRSVELPDWQSHFDRIFRFI
jgi:glycosyltransferase involved in cell wall biosynthesis